MKNNNYFRTLVGALALGTIITACDKFEDDVPPGRMENLAVHDDFYSTTKNHGVQLHVLANDTIGSTATLQFSQPQQGTIQTDSTGNVYYQPAPNFVGTDVFTYKACLDDNCATANVTVTVKNDSTINCVVRAFDDIRNRAQNTIDTTKVLLNDELCGLANSTVVSIIQPPAHGRATVVNAGKWIFFHPDVNYVGPDEVTYSITNSKGTSVAKVYYNFTSAPQYCRPVPATDSAYIHRTLGQMDTVSVKILANDYICPQSGPATVYINGQNQSYQTQYGVFTLVGTGLNRRIIYLTTAGKNFTDKVLYTLCQNGTCSSTYLYVHVK